MKTRGTAQALSKDIDHFLATSQIAHNNPLLLLAAEMAAGTTAKPAPDFAQRLRNRLLENSTQISSPIPHRVRARLGEIVNFPLLPKFITVVQHASIIPRWVWMTCVLCMLLATMVASPAFRGPSTAKILARTIDALAIEPGHIIYQVYTSHGGLYQEWQRMDITAQNRIATVEKITIRYNTNDVTFTQPQEWFYITPGKFCTLDRAEFNTFDPARDIVGCRTYTVDDADPLAPLPGEDLQQRLHRLQTDIQNVVVERSILDNHDVYKLTYTRHNPQPGIRITTEILYIDTTTYLPTGYAYTIEPHDEAIYEWQTTVLEYVIYEPADLVIDPFIWPPADSAPEH